MAAIRVTVYYTPSSESYSANVDHEMTELEMIEQDIESLDNGAISLDEIIEIADHVSYDPMPGWVPGGDL